jgi:retron-type reverse transcriptase
MSDQVLEDIINRLKDESYQFLTARRVFLPKPSGTGPRPITIYPLPKREDKIVQEAMRMILNAIYEPLFQEDSHGFRPNRGCHSALKHVNQKFQAST